MTTATPQGQNNGEFPCLIARGRPYIHVVVSLVAPPVRGYTDPTTCAASQTGRLIGKGEEMKTGTHVTVLLLLVMCSSCTRSSVGLDGRRCERIEQLRQQLIEAQKERDAAQAAFTEATQQSTSQPGRMEPREPEDVQVCEQLDTIVDLSTLSPEMPLNEAIETESEGPIPHPAYSMWLLLPGCRHFLAHCANDHYPCQSSLSARQAYFLAASAIPF